MYKGVCCFFGHREIIETKELKKQINNIIEELILQKQVRTFLFGSKSRFNSLCHELVTEAKEKHPHIKRIYVRGEFPYINEDYKNYLLKSYEDTYYPQHLLNAGKAVYIERNFEMIDRSDFCVVYYQENCVPTKRKSGTLIALNYAIKNKKEIILLPKQYK